MEDGAILIDGEDGDIARGLRLEGEVRMAWA
jgi:hypothetical protein